MVNLVDQFTYFGHNISSTESDVNISLAKIWNVIEKLSIIWKLDLSDKKLGFFQAVALFLLLYGCTTWPLTKHIEKRLDENHTRMLHAVLKKSWKQHSIK